MIDDRVREDLAVIREAIEDGQTYAASCGPGMVVWGGAIAIGYLGTYAWLRGWRVLEPDWLWAICLALPWLYTLGGLARRLARSGDWQQRTPMVMALRMLWLGCGIVLTTLAVAAMSSGDVRSGWLSAVVAGVLAIAAFTTAWLTGLAWLRWIAAGWWIGEVALYALRTRPEALLLAAALMMLLYAAPGVALAFARR